MAVAIGIQGFYPVYLEPCFCISFRVQFHKLHLLIGYRCKEGYIVILSHGMDYRNIVFVFSYLHRNRVLFILILRLQQDSLRRTKYSY